jgi:hypothetical protein
VCANEDVVLHCGQTRCRVLDWRDLSSFCEHRFSIVEGGGQLLKDLDPDLAVSYFLGWLRFVDEPMHGSRRSRSIWDKLSSDLSNLFDRGCWQTTDPRDRVYAMLVSMPGFMALHLKPNYRMDTEEVFVRTTVEILKVNQSWSAEQFIYPSASPFLPSWTIDFTLPTAATRDRQLWCHRYLEKRFKAHGCARSRIRESKPGVLLSAGFVYDEIVAVTPVFSPLDLNGVPADEFSEARSLFWKWWNFLINSNTKDCISSNPAYAHEIDLWVSYCRTLCVDSRDFASKAASFRQWRLDNSSAGVGQAMPYKLGIELRSDIFRTTRLVTTRKGRIGLAPLTVERGDYIAILAGGQVPFALRKARKEGVYRDAYRLLGGCYVDGQPSNSTSS